MDSSFTEMDTSEELNSCEEGEIVENQEDQASSSVCQDKALPTDPSCRQLDYGRLKYEDDDYFDTLFSAPPESQVGQKPRIVEGEHLSEFCLVKIFARN